MSDFHEEGELEKNAGKRQGMSERMMRRGPIINRAEAIADQAFKEFRVAARQNDAEAARIAREKYSEATAVVRDLWKEVIGG